MYSMCLVGSSTSFQIAMSLMNLQRRPLPAIYNDRGASISNQFKWLGTWDLFNSCTTERNLCFKLHMCRHSSCLVVKGLMDGNPWQTDKSLS